MKHIEIIVPCYNEQECIAKLYIEVNKVFSQLSGYSFSLLYINDGSSDDTLVEIQKLASDYGDDKIRYISFARNFGKEAAIYAGFENCQGDYVALMDADLQHPPALLPDMIAKLEEGHDCCGARRVSRNGEPIIRSFFSRGFYRIINKVTSMKLVPGGSDYRIMTKQMADAIVSLSERERFIKGIMSWVGFDTVWIEYKNVERFAGNSKWSFWGLARYAWHGFVSFATTPLRAAVWLGICLVAATVVYAVILLKNTLSGVRAWEDTTTIILLLMLMGGVIITLLGVIGEYMARIYLELKGRPIYISKVSNIDKMVK
ncbi:MAG: glycosyltransferase family 2 protein [Butyrivibrio sp.]|uniref:glycosyltransferase family 2 protein n=1 Tax=Butyrivibrio sp. TaxID=28121 RepID=UPI0025BF5A77|nr:glycosyltransferase family 2 protein [Butyrivibrio sp.]MBQ6587226.1 glycosyltransferase family 2 protein [Butyrivibrio sp.]